MLEVAFAFFSSERVQSQSCIRQCWVCAYCMAISVDGSIKLIFLEEFVCNSYILNRCLSKTSYFIQSSLRSFWRTGKESAFL